MKLLLLSFVLISFSICAQKSGEIRYDVTVNLHKYLTKANEKYKAFLPEFKESNRKLLFNSKFALYENMEQDIKSVEEGNSWVNFEPDNKYYHNLQQKTVLKKIDFMGKPFLVLDTLKRLKWKITGQSKIIENYPCISAELKDTTGVYTAWFTPKIQVQIGPEHFGQLPGLILEISSADTAFVIRAKYIELKEITTESIPKPKKGKKMSNIAFKAMVEEKVKELEEIYGKGAGMSLKAH